MRCPYCSHLESRVTDSRVGESGVRRRRECDSCGLRFTTYERTQTTALWVGKLDGRREEFNRDKLLSGIVKACAKRPIPAKEIEKVVEDLESRLQALGRAEIPSDLIGEMVMERLKELDRVAHVRFASVYRDFQDIESFEQAVEDLRHEPPSEQLPLIEGVPPPRRGRKRRSKLNRTRDKRQAIKNNGPNSPNRQK